MPVNDVSESTQMESYRKASGLKSVIYSIVSRIGIIAINAATGIITARTLRPEGRGELAAAIIWSLFLASATTLGLPSSVVFYLRKRPELTKSLSSSALLMSFVLGVAAAVLGWWWLPVWLHKYSRELIRNAQWLLLLTPICSLTLTGRAILEALDRFTESNAIQAFGPLVTLLSLSALAVTRTLTPLTAGLSYTLVALPSLFLIARRLRKAGISPAWPRIEESRLLLGYGIRSYGVDLLGTLALQVDQVLVVSMLSASAMGAYVVVLSLSRMLNLFQNSVVMVLFPKSAGLGREDILLITSRAARVSLAVTACSAVLLSLSGPLLLRIMYGREYLGALSSLRVLLAEVTLSGLVFVLAQAYMAMGRPGLVTFLQGVGLSCSVPLMLWLIPKEGVLGAALALLGSTLIRLVLIMLGFRFMLDARFPDLILKRTDLQMLSDRLSSMLPGKRIQIDEL